MLDNLYENKGGKIKNRKSKPVGFGRFFNNRKPRNTMRRSYQMISFRSSMQIGRIKGR